MSLIWMVFLLNFVVLLVSLLFMAGPGVIATPVHELILRQVSAATSATKNTTHTRCSACRCGLCGSWSACLQRGCCWNYDCYFSAVDVCLNCFGELERKLHCFPDARAFI
ncbi:hypothetical protein DFH05DRAFT_340733 [Lentinula detonsa]|uniref:P-type domain-containing protein n=1 Tax=Lentinula detonsa TaxID=2804962 RepID=A0A9W8TTI2_9AGAR|nr:hypothetical protein DFH05DRAFT_526837 [Lentinula detonsa]KAJ3741428.1 hypothetical protein DFH05DRAFT_340733 [Lentinula detonsa]